MSDDENFLKRWSRRKHEAASGDAARDAEGTDDAAPQTPPLESLGPDSDFSAFMHPKIDPALRRAALARLFSSPQFHGSDGLDVYIDDYSNPVELEPAAAALLRHARSVLDPASGPEQAPVAGANDAVVPEPGDGSEAGDVARDGTADDESAAGKAT